MVILGWMFLTVFRLVVVCDVKCLIMNLNTCLESRMKREGYVFGACISARASAWASPWLTSVCVVPILGGNRWDAKRRGVVKELCHAWSARLGVKASG